jgi:phosphoribosyl-ATP pyrophosphohydrolase
MKNIILLLMIALIPLGVLAQADSQGNVSDSVTANDTLPDNGEAGGIVVAENVSGKSNALKDNWVYLALGAIVIAIASSAITRALMANKTKTPEQKIQEEPAETTVETKTKDTKASAAELKKLKAEAKTLMAQVQELQTSNANLDRNLEIYRNFDSGYFNEAFRKLVAPMNEAMEKGSEKEILENMLKITGHFSSLTRYKISKKQPYDEANIHYLLNQKTGNENVAVDINGSTPIDKIPKNIKTIIDMLKQQDSKGLDDSIIAGYKIKNL